MFSRLSKINYTIFYFCFVIAAYGVFILLVYDAKAHPASVLEIVGAAAALLTGWLATLEVRTPLSAVSAALIPYGVYALTTYLDLITNDIVSVIVLCFIAFGAVASALLGAVREHVRDKDSIFSLVFDMFDEEETLPSAFFAGAALIFIVGIVTVSQFFERVHIVELERSGKLIIAVIYQGGFYD